MEQIIIKENSIFFSYYRFEDSIIALTKNQCDLIDICIHDFNHLENVPDEFKVDCYIMQFDAQQKTFFYDDSAIKQSVSVNKLGYLIKQIKY